MAGRQGTRVKPQAVVEQGEPARGQDQTPAIDGVFRGEGVRAIRLACLVGETGGGGLELARGQFGQQMRAGRHAVSGARRQTLGDQPVASSFEGLGDCSAESGAEGRPVRIDAEAIEPGCAVRLDLTVQGQIGADAQMLMAQARALGRRRLDDGADGGIGQGGVMDGAVVQAAVEPFDQHIACARQFVVQTARGHPSDHRLGGLLGGPGRRGEGASVRRHRVMQAGDEVALARQGLERRLGLRRQAPASDAGGPRQAQGLELAKPRQPYGRGRRRRLATDRPQVDQAVVAPGLRSEEAVEPGPAIGRCVLGQASGDLAFAAGTELALDQGFGAAAQTLGDIVAADDQIGAGIVDAAHDQMDMGMGRVPVIDGDPVEARVEIGLHGLDQVAGETPQIRYLVGVFGRDD